MISHLDPGARDMAFDWRLPQSRYFIIGNPKAIAHDLEVDRHTVNAWRLSQWPAPLHQAFAASASQKDWTYVRLVGEYYGIVLKMLRTVEHSISSKRLVTGLVGECGHFFLMAEKIEEDEALSDEEMQQLEKAGEQLKDTVDTLIARERQKRREKRLRSNGEFQD